MNHFPEGHLGMFLNLIVLFWITPGLAKGTDILVGIPNDQSPHIYLTESAIAGDQGQALDKKLREAGFTPRYQTFPSRRVVTKFRKNEIDAAINVPEASLPEAYKSDFKYKFQNCAYTLKKKKIELKEPEDLKGLRVAAFKNATFSFKDEDINLLAKSYHEVQSIRSRIKLLNAGRIDVLISEKEIFSHTLSLYDLGKKEDYQEHCFFSPNYYWLVFRNKKNLDLFRKVPN